MRYVDDKTKIELSVEREISTWIDEHKTKSVEDITKIAIQNYIHGVISLDDLSCILGDLYFKVIKNPKHSLELANILEIGSDLAYSERFSNNFLSDLREVLSYK